MASKLLEKTRRLNKVLQTQGDLPVSFEALAELLRDTLRSNVYIVENSGKILGASFSKEEESSVIVNKSTGEQFLPLGYGKKMAKIETSAANLTGDDLLKLFDKEQQTSHKYATVLPIFGKNRRLGSIILSRAKKKFTDEDLILAEISATVVGMEIIRAKAQEKEADARKIEIVKMAIDTLSYSELQAIYHIFDELKGNEAVLIASRIADRAGITRSVIVNALRKFESAGVIATRSLGMKGTRIKVLNDKLKLQLKRVRND